MQQEVVLAMLAKEPSHGYQLRARLRPEALKPVGEALNDAVRSTSPCPGWREGQARVTAEQAPGQGIDKSDRKVYALTAAGHQRVADWLSEVALPRPDLAEFHLKLIAAAAARLADPIAIVDAQRRELLHAKPGCAASGDGRAGRLGCSACFWKSTRAPAPG